MKSQVGRRQISKRYEQPKIDAGSYPLGWQEFTKLKAVNIGEIVELSYVAGENVKRCSRSGRLFGTRVTCGVTI